MSELISRVDIDPGCLAGDHWRSTVLAWLELENEILSPTRCMLTINRWGQDEVPWGRVRRKFRAAFFFASERFYASFFSAPKDGWLKKIVVIRERGTSGRCSHAKQKKKENIMSELENDGGNPQANCEMLFNMISSGCQRLSRHRVQKTRLSIFARVLSPHRTARRLTSIINDFTNLPL